MAHVPDGVLSTPVLVGGALGSLTLLTLSLRRLDYGHLPHAAVLSAAFFVSSLISVPLGPSSVHLLLNGLMGVMLGWTAVPALLVALSLQLVFFGHGGLAALGVNTLNMAIPALLCGLALRPRLARAGPGGIFRIGAAAGGAGVLLTGLLVVLSLVLSDRAFLPAVQILALSVLPLALVEALVTGTVLSFLARVDPGSVLGEGAGRA
jgi:cobalt/nickel transport system permease protein